MTFSNSHFTPDLSHIVDGIEELCGVVCRLGDGHADKGRTEVWISEDAWRTRAKEIQVADISGGLKT